MLKAALLFGSNMVLQRDKLVPVWGTASPGAQIQIHMQGQTVLTQASEDGSWRVNCGPFALSFEEQMEICSNDETLRFSHVQVGDVYLAGGQSNMEFHMRYDQDFATEKNRCHNASIRFFDYPEVSYPGQIDERDYLKHYGFWRIAEPQQLERFSAVGYYFAKEIQNTLHIPVGIIGCNWGGTPAAAWMSRKAILLGKGRLILDEYEQSVKTLDLEEYERRFQADPGVWRTDQFASPITDIIMYGGTDEEIIQRFQAIGMDMSHVNPDDFLPLIGPKSERRPSGLYESMLCEVAPYAIRGILWYQGETDGDTHPELYKTLFPALIGDWRKLWGEELPFLFVQIAPLERWLDCIGENYVAIRDAQQHTADSVPGTGMAVISDIGSEYDIHPKKKQPVGYRLALLALNHIYGVSALCEAPLLNMAETEDGKLTLRFIHAGKGLYLTDRTPDGSRVDGTRLCGLQIFQSGRLLRGEMLHASAKGDQVTITGPEIMRDQPTLMRIARTGWYRVNLYNSANIPARPSEYHIGEE